MNIIKLLICILLPQFIGGLSAFLGGSFVKYSFLAKPPFSPPGEVFGIAWVILYFLMGIASYLIVKSSSPVEKQALVFYAAQLFMNFCWSLIFFRWDMKLLAFIWLLALLFLLLLTYRRFREISALAGYLLIPYILWLLFAGYLTIGVWYLNR